MPNVFHMHTDLMGASGFQMKFDEGVGDERDGGSFLDVVCG